MDDYITKPVRAEVLTEVLDRWIVLETESGEPSAGGRDGSTSGDGTGARQRWAGRPSTWSASRSIRDLDGGDGTLLRTLAAEYPGRTARRQAGVLRAAVGEGDPEVVERAAHSLKGASAVIGAVGLSELCSQLKLLGRGRAPRRRGRDRRPHRPGGRSAGTRRPRHRGADP